MLIDGEKWACEACVRGHRVSSCHHSDRPLTHINKKGRPVSQCAHCRGLRKSRTTHTKCECGDKKKTSHKNELDPHAAEKRDLKQDSHSRCGCTHGQRCTCALKKEPHLDTVPETGLPPPPPAALLDQPKKPQLTSTKSESTLTIFRDGHHKPAHKHNDMAHKCGLPYTIPRSHTIHSTSDVARRSVDHLPLAQSTMMGEGLASQQPAEQSPTRGLHRRVKSEHGSPESAPVMPPDNISTTVTPLDLSSFFPQVQPLDKPSDVGVPEPASMPMAKTPLDDIVTAGLPLDVSSFSSFPTTATSPVNCLAFQDPYKEPFFTSPEGDMSLGSAPFSAPPVDWSSFPLYASDVPTATSTQAPSYASFDYNSMAPGFPAPSSSGDISEADEFAPIPGLGRTGSDLHDLNSVSEGSDIDHFRLSSASSFIGLPQAQLLSSNNLDSIDIDDFLKSANESTAALEHQLQANMGMEAKPLPSQDAFALPNTEAFKPATTPTASMPMATSPTEPVWPVTLYDPNAQSMDDNGNNFFVPPWVQ
ncbi:copper fist DNA binding domain protein [Aspergillus heteromorphus CBS 117.55]|uniref:Copper fist DNA binding domain protein n=1 Tax=Aspergillus heteromorphus CBS 117.55 TaxID=1448321 RepID=A0A317VXG3_9EURO|nr:copper fist DNA binding domain protein [Aspergillus heteromorphus CBS 117.55]PWY78319.1 copper fist DNA binding domain protein [Aspergillus heteromorphus CBS 117.55]